MCVCCVCVCVCVRVCVCMCVGVCMCVCVCLCYGEAAASISSLANWSMVLCIYVYICKLYKCTDKDSLRICCIHPAQFQTLIRVIDYVFWSQLPLLQPLQTGLLLLGLKGLKKWSS